MCQPRVNMNWRRTCLKEGANHPFLHLCSAFAVLTRADFFQRSTRWLVFLDSSAPGIGFQCLSHGAKSERTVLTHPGCPVWRVAYILEPQPPNCYIPPYNYYNIKGGRVNIPSHMHWKCLESAIIITHHEATKALWPQVGLWATWRRNTVQHLQRDHMAGA